jgi:hypothetical protein
MGAGTVSRDARPMPCDGGEHARLGAYSGRWAAWSGTMRALEPRWLGALRSYWGLGGAMSSMRHSILGDGGAVRRGE